MLHVVSKGETVAYINKQDRRADNFNREEPWMLLHVRGRIDRFATQAEAKEEARKAWPAVSFTRGEHA